MLQYFFIFLHLEIKFLNLIVIDNSHDRPNFNPGKTNKLICHYSWDEHLKISKIAKFDSKML